MEITAKTKLMDVLQAYPFLEEKIIGVAPIFQNLRNPVLRRTVGKLATIEKVAEIGGVDVNRFVNTLRRAAGQAELSSDGSTNLPTRIPRDEADPAWIAGEPEYLIDGVALLNRGEVPLIRVNELLVKLSPARFLLLVTNFEPGPIQEAMQKQNRKVFSKANPENTGQYLTFIQ